jgi:hypothetical protein
LLYWKKNENKVEIFPSGVPIRRCKKEVKGRNKKAGSF